jgi:hypothetical protein
MSTTIFNYHYCTVLTCGWYTEHCVHVEQLVVFTAVGRARVSTEPSSSQGSAAHPCPI